MEERLHSIWQRIKRHPYAAGFGILVVLILFIILAYGFGWDWTGFNSGTSQITITNTSNGSYTATLSQPSKSLWDWLQLLGVLAIPAVVGLGAAWYTAQQGKVSDAANRQQHETELQIAEENRRENALQTYIDKMSELLLGKKLRDLAIHESDEVLKIARVRTLTVLRGLDAKRKASLLQFMYESDLIAKDHCIINLKGADLKNANLERTNLSGADLKDTDLSGAKLERINLSKADLSHADLSYADLRGANLSGANLSGANLSGANLCLTDLTQADLSGTDLGGSILVAARLRGANLSRVQAGSKLYTIVDELPASLLEVPAANLAGADLEEANLSDADLTRACLVGANLHGADLHRVVLNEANLSNTMVIHFGEVGARSVRDALWPYYIYADQCPSKIKVSSMGDSISPDKFAPRFASRANLSEAKLEQADLSRANLSDTNLSGAHLGGAKLMQANLSDAVIEEANLTEAILMGANLNGASLEGANLEGANFGEAFAVIGTSETKLPGTNRSMVGGQWGYIKTDLHDAKVTDEQLKQAKTLKGAIMPDGTEHP